MVSSDFGRMKIMRLNLPEKELQIKEKIQNREKAVWLKMAVYAFAAFAFSQFKAIDNMSPFCVAFAAGAPFDFCYACFLGGALGSFVALGWKEALRYTCSLFLVSVFRLVIEKRFSEAKGEIVNPIVALSSILSCSLVYLALTEFSLSALLLVLCEGALTLFSTYFFSRSFKTPVASLGIGNIAAQDAAGIVLSLCILLMCASGLTLGHISPARIIACFAVLFSANYKGVRTGNTAGVCIGTALCIDPSYRFLLGFYAIGGLVCGVFSPLGQYAISIFFSLTCAVAAFVSGLNERILWCLVEILIACAVFFIIPAKWLDAAREYLKKSGIAPDDSINRYASASLQRAAQTVGEVSDIVTKVSGKLDNVINPEINVIFSKLQQNICFGCSFKSECWNTRYSETASDILTISGVQNSDAERTSLEKRCPRARALVSQIEQSYTDFVGSMASKAKVKELRSIVTDQLSGVADFLSEIAEQVSNSRVVDNVKSRTLKTALSDGGIYVDSLNYFTNPNGRVTIEITMLEDAFDLDNKKIKKIFELSTKRRFEHPEVAIMDLRTTVTFEEKAVFKVIFGRSQLPFRENTVCGDCVETLSDMNGNRIALISDGMGTGSRAAVDSILASTLMEKLLSCGFSFSSALKMVNCSLMVKSTDESIATVDGISINVYTGEVDFYKAGAAISFIRRGSLITTVEEQSLPVGILRDVSFAHRKTKLDYGDIVVLASDGVTFGDCGWINDELLAWSTNNMDDLASHIASLAKLRSDENTNDDISVVTAKIMKN